MRGAVEKAVLSPAVQHSKGRKRNNYNGIVAPETTKLVAVAVSYTDINQDYSCSSGRHFLVNFSFLFWASLNC